MVEQEGISDLMEKDMVSFKRIVQCVVGVANPQPTIQLYSRDESRSRSSFIAAETPVQNGTADGNGTAGGTLDELGFLVDDLVPFGPSGAFRPVTPSETRIRAY